MTVDYRCGALYFCPEGGRGPCRSGQVLVSGRPRRGRSELSCPGQASLYSLGCYMMDTRGPWVDLSPYDGHCSSLDHPCSSYPSSYRFSKTTGRCHRMSDPNSGYDFDLVSIRDLTISNFHFLFEFRSSDHCGQDQLFVDVDGVNGECRCRDPNNVFWPETNTCYRVYTPVRI
jgi:hypothetical protein